MMTRDYKAACEAAARDQGVDVVIAELAKRGIKADLLQTGGFTMCWNATTRDGRFVQGNSCVAAVFTSYDAQPESMVATVCQFGEDEHRGVEVAEAVAAWIAEHDETRGRVIADAFDALLRKEVGDDAYGVIVASNVDRADGSCASHEFCDANMVMVEAIKQCGEEANEEKVFDAAWAIWMRVYCKFGGAA